MNSGKRVWIEVDESGRLVLPPEMAVRLGLVPGSRALAVEEGQGLVITSPATHLARVYVEPTNLCNLDCSTCMRNVWNEPDGWMDPGTFERVICGLAEFTPTPTVFFGGYGEPLSHPAILEMVRLAKAAGAPVELITNGILLDEKRAAGLVEAGLDCLWVSIDGASPEKYADVRLGNALPQVIQNLHGFNRLRSAAAGGRPQLGIAFVAMRRNLSDLPDVIRLGLELGASAFSVSNVLAHTPELRREILYERSLYTGAALASETAVRVDLPRMDASPDMLESLGAILHQKLSLRLGGASLGRRVDVCPFVEKSSLAVRWDGAVSPCLPLLHSHVSFLEDRLRRSEGFEVGRLAPDRSLRQIWLEPGYVALRQRLQEFDFSPCAHCNTCDLSDANREDCFGNALPTCGGCLWAQGLIQCP